MALAWRAGWIGWIARASALAVAASACGGTDDAQGTPGSESAIFGGVRDDDALAMPGVVALRVGRDGAYDICSGALLAPNVVLTARHCVAQNLADAISCDEEGRATNAVAHVAGEEAPANISVFVGAAPRFSRSPDAVAATIVAPGGDVLCDSDIALVVLDRELSGVAPFAVRTSASARVGETIRAVGYGRNDAKTPMGTRFRKENVPVLAVGKGVSASRTRLGAREFEVGKSICEGDSGGPAISEATGAVIGVVSRGGPCGDDFGHVYTSTAGFEDLFERAFAAAETRPIVETNTPPADVEPEPGAAGSAAAEGPAPEGTGCSVTAPRTEGPSTVTWLLLAAVVVLSRRASAPRAR